MKRKIIDIVKESTLSVSISIMILVMFIFLICFSKSVYCKINGPAYEMDHICHDPNVRCEFECAVYNLNFTGNIIGCECICNNNTGVSVCSGAKRQLN